MTYSIQSPIAYSGVNSLSTEPCVLMTVVLHASYLTTREPHLVGNPRRPAVPDAACNAFGEIDGWVR